MDESGKKILKAVSYIFWPVGLISFLIAEEDKDMKFHGAQGLTFGLMITILWYMIFGFLGWVWFIFGYFAQLLGLAFLIGAIVFAVKAYKGERFRIPVIYDLMRLIYKEEENHETPVLGEKK